MPKIAMEKSKKLNYNDKLIIIVSLTLLVFTGLIFAKLFILEHPPLIWDAATHYIDSVKYYQSITNMKLKNLPYIDRYWPPLGPMMAIPGYILFGVNPQTGIFVENILSILLLTLAIYKLSEYFGKKVSAIAIFITLTSPIILDQATTFMLDIPLTSIVAMEWYLLLKSNGFENTKYTILSGLFFGLGLLAKWTFVFFILIPLLYELMIAFQVECNLGNINIEPTNNVIKNLTIFILSVIIIAGWWYIPNIKLIIKSLIRNSTIAGAIEGNPKVLTLNSILYYFFTTINFYLNFILLGLLIIGLGLLFKTKRTVYIRLVISQIVFVYVLFTLTRNKDPRFMMPIIPFLGIVIGEIIYYLESRKKLLQIIFIVILLFGGFLNIATFTKAIPQIKIAENPNIISVSGGSVYLSGYYWSFNLNTTEEEWHIKEILSILKEDNRSYILVYVLSNNPVLTYPLRYRTITWEKTVTVVRPNVHQLIPGLFSADYILYTKSEKYSARWEIKYSRLAREIFVDYNNITKTFVPVEKFQFPDGTIGILYKRLSKVPIPPNVKTKEMSVTCQRSNSTFGNEIQLRAVCIYQIRGIYMIGYYWRSLRRINKNYHIFVHLTNKEGKTQFQLDHMPCAGLCPTSTWTPQRDIMEMYYFQFQLTGCYQIRLGFWNPQTKTRLKVVGNNDGHNRAIVGKICKFINIKLS